MIQQLERHGLTLTLDGDRLRVAPRNAITPPLAELIRSHKPALIADLQARQAQPCPDLEDVREFYEERAAIIEYDGGLSRPEAEAEAVRLVAVRFRLDLSEGGGDVIARDCTIAEVINGLKARYGNRLATTEPPEGTKP